MVDHTWQVAWRSIRLARVVLVAIVQILLFASAIVVVRIVGAVIFGFVSGNRGSKMRING